LRKDCAFQFPTFKKSKATTKIEKLRLIVNDLDKTAADVKHPFPPRKTFSVNAQEYWRELQETPPSIQSF